MLEKVFKIKCWIHLFSTQVLNLRQLYLLKQYKAFIKIVSVNNSYRYSVISNVEKYN